MKSLRYWGYFFKLHVSYMGISLNFPEDKIQSVVSKKYSQVKIQKYPLCKPFYFYKRKTNFKMQTYF